MKKWFYRLYALIVRDIAKQLATQIRKEQEKVEKFNAWQRRNSKLIHRERAIAALNEEPMPEIEDIYQKYRSY